MTYRRNNKNNSSGNNHSHPMILLRCSGNDATWFDKVYVMASSLLAGTSLVWVPCVYIYIYRKWKSIPTEQKRKRTIYGILILSITYLVLFGPHRSIAFGKKYIKPKEWKLWKSFMRFCAAEVIKDYRSNRLQQAPPTIDNKNHNNNHHDPSSSSSLFDFQKSQAILAFAPHGIFPFALAGSAVPIDMTRVFGAFRQVVATATTLLPIARDIIGWDNPVDASKSSVNHALQKGDRLGVIPGGIAEMFETYPKPLLHPNDECIIIPKGFIKMSIKHNVPILPVYCFGLSNMFHRVDNRILEKISNVLRMSLCLFFGQFGLPIPFRTKLLYVIGEPIFPPPTPTLTTPNATTTTTRQEQLLVNDMHQVCCQEIMRLFECYKHYYGWGEKSLRIVSR